MSDDDGGKFYNTTHLRGVELRVRRANAEQQYDAVKELFVDNPEAKLSREDVGRLVLPGSPVTSAGRCLCNLTDDGILEKLGDDHMVMGEYGMKIHTWRLKRPAPVLTCPEAFGPGPVVTTVREQEKEPEQEELF